MCKVIVFAGTTEGREIAEFLEISGPPSDTGTYLCGY